MATATATTTNNTNSRFPPSSASESEQPLAISAVPKKRISLKDELDEFLFSFMDASPQEILDILIDKAERLAMSGIAERAVHRDDIAPHFALPNATAAARGGAANNNNGNKLVSVNDLTRDGPVIVTFFRGMWCPYCNITLRSLQKHLPQFQAKGATLVAISPQLPEHSEATVKEMNLEYAVLSDVGSKVGMEYGLTFVLDEELRPLYEDLLGAHLPSYNGDGSFKLPIPATYVIDTDGTVLYSFVNTDYTKRAEPEDILNAIPDYGFGSGGW